MEREEEQAFLLERAKIIRKARDIGIKGPYPTKTCQYCVQPIPLDARVCKFCTREVATAEEADRLGMEYLKIAIAQRERQWRRRIIVAVVIGAVVFLLSLRRK